MKLFFKTFVFAVSVLFALNSRAGFFKDLSTAVLATNSAAATTSATNVVVTNAPPATNHSTSLLSKLTGTPSVAALSQDQVVGGLKEALGKGVERAVSSLGHDGGFLTNLNVKIPLPEKLQTVEKTLRLAGQSQLADDFVGSMNHAAEKAVPVAAGVFGDAIKQMSIADGKAILSGASDSATQFFRRTTQTNLQAKFYPIVQKATDAVGVTAKYKAMMGKFTAANSLGSLLGKSSPALLNTADIDSYVTDKAMDGLFKMVADEEKSIRANPVARTTELLKTVFGSVAK